jgi:hypothetical protein
MLADTREAGTRRRPSERWRATLAAGAAALGLAAVAIGAVQREPRGAQVEAIFPTADRLPANLLRLYIVFSEPMSSGEAHARLRLVDERDQTVAGAFLELDEELWDPTGRRLTVLLDPGRIKRGLRANLESGAPLVEGRRYRLEIDGAWRDGHGVPLLRGASKAFSVVAADRTAPQLEAWDVAAPPAGTRLPLVVRFPESLDRALLASAIGVEDCAGETVEGTIHVTDAERRWTFTPSAPWRPGRHQLRVAAEIEDVAGNSPRRLFDTDLSQAIRTDIPSVLRRPVIIRPAS